MPKKVNLYKWHRMKKKLISSVISILCCLAVMAVGVYASTTAQFNVTIANDIDIRISVVDGRLSAKRRGGVYSETIETLYGQPGAISPDFLSENWKANFNTETNRSDKDIPDFWYKDFVPLYEPSMNRSDIEKADSTLQKIQKQKLDINAYYNEIEYIFRYEVEANNGFPTYISLEDIAGDGNVGQGLYYEYVNNVDVDASRTGENYKISNYITLKYQYIVGGSDLQEPTRDQWETSASTISDFPVRYGTENQSVFLEIGGNKKAGEETTPNTVIYIRCYLSYNTEEKGNEKYDPTLTGSLSDKNGMIDSSHSSKATFFKKWKFKLTFTNADK